MGRRTLALLCLISGLPLLACAAKQPATAAVANTGLAACPASPNCVSSQSTDPAHRIAPFVPTSGLEEAWRVLREEVARLPRTTIVHESEDALHAEAASAVFGFVDDLEFRRSAPASNIEVRSASRVGYSDMGANRKRVERLRDALRARGVGR